MIEKRELMKNISVKHVVKLGLLALFCCTTQLSLAIEQLKPTYVEPMSRGRTVEELKPTYVQPRKGSYVQPRKGSYVQPRKGSSVVEKLQPTHNVDQRSPTNPATAKPSGGRRATPEEVANVKRKIYDLKSDRIYNMGCQGQYRNGVKDDRCW